MNYLLQIKNFLNSQFISTIIGVLVGGVLTIRINNVTERKKIIMDLKIEIWGNIKKYLDIISNSIVEIETNIELYKNKNINEKEMTKCFDKEIYNISKTIPFISREISNNILVIQEVEYFTYNITESCNDSIKKILDIKNGDLDIKKEFSKIENSIKNLDEAFVYLSGNLQSTLLKSLYTKKQINRLNKKLNK
ncbi:hypothetical protein HYH84_12535 [Clostridium botulinum]|uniref:hypothetical protein n=1 Tax=Clostridium botulinum TaxID=1491 RepID=UPI0013F76A18|nr:hypothetical protein [Clostridium botulinum]MBY6761762.1 hypothetical protein [Clostridium botulinum]NFG27227.1 hypothetical protein [Clostridium botulinum]